MLALSHPLLLDHTPRLDRTCRSVLAWDWDFELDTSYTSNTFAILCLDGRWSQIVLHTAFHSYDNTRGRLPLSVGLVGSDNCQVSLSY